MPVSRQPQIPVIDIDLVAEYVAADADRRRELLLERSVVDTDAPRYFRAAEETVCAYLLGIPKQERTLTTKIEALRRLGAFVPEKFAKIGDNIEALESFLNHPKRKFLDGLDVFPGPRDGTLRLAGVDIAVRPEILAVDGRTDSFGFVKFRYSRRPLEPKEADCLAAMHYAFAQMCSARLNGTLNLDLTCVVDVFDGTIIRAGAVRVGRWGLVRAACAEIAAQWGLLVSRPGLGFSARRRN
jgi:hypothetical protein